MELAVEQISFGSQLSTIFGRDECPVFSLSLSLSFICWRQSQSISVGCFQCRYLHRVTDPEIHKKNKYIFQPLQMNVSQHRYHWLAKTDYEEKNTFFSSPKLNPFHGFLFHQTKKYVFRSLFNIQNEKNIESVHCTTESREEKKTEKKKEFVCVKMIRNLI